MTTEKNAPRIGKTSSHACLGRVSPMKSINPQWLSCATILSRKPGVGGNLSRLTAKEREGIERIPRRRKSRGLQSKRLETMEVQACIGSEVVPGQTRLESGYPIHCDLESPGMPVSLGQKQESRWGLRI
jgi:hypothetical protein